MDKYVERFHSKYKVNDETGCWDWTASKNHLGYGQYWDGKRRAKAHRFSYEALVGPIPEGLVIDHLCRNRGCVNPAHLEPVTQRRNVLRGEGMGAINARKTHCKHGHPFTPENTIKHPNGYGCRLCRNAATRRSLARKRARERGLPEESVPPLLR